MTTKAERGTLLLASLLSILALNASTGLDAWWLPAWVAPAGVLLAAFRVRWGTAALLSFAIFFAGALRLAPYLSSLVPAVVVLAFLAARASACTLAVLVARAAERQFPPTLAVLAFPLAWTAMEFAASASPHGTFLSLAYTQAAFLPVLQAASVAGVWGVTFVLTLGASALAFAIDHRGLRVARPALACVAAVLLFGTVRLAMQPSGPGQRVGLAVTDAGAGTLFANTDGQVAMRTIREYGDRVARLAQQGIAVAVLPEKLVGVPPAAAGPAGDLLAAAARASGVTIVAGLNLTDAAPPRNVALVVGADGRVAGEYDKHHLLPGPETGYAVGNTPVVFDVHGVRWGVAICKDMDFPSWSRRYARTGVRIMAVPAWDFVRDARLHARMAVVRGVENGFAVARAALEGSLTVSDAYGRIAAETTSAWRPDALLVTTVMPGPGATVYTRTGDWLGWLSVAGTVAFAGTLIARRRR